MNYTWNINTWVKQSVGPTLRKPNRIGITIALLSGLKWFYTDFNTFRAFVYLRVKYNSQQRLLAYMLNQAFGTGTLITVRTLSDDFPANYLFGENDVPVGYDRFYLSSVTPKYLSASATRLRGEIVCPASLVAKENEIRAWVDFVIFEGKNYRIVFI